MEGMLFPSPGDNRAHRDSSTRRKNKQAATEKRASEIKNSDDLCDYIMEIARTKYRQGDRKIKFIVEVPSSNFIEWAQKTKVASAQMDQMDKVLVRRALVRLVKELIRTRIKTNVLFMLEGANSHKQSISFTVQFTILGRR